MSRTNKTGKLPKGITFDNGTYQVSTALLSTPRRFYPIANTTARIRRDPLWMALGFTAFAALATITYGDLLYASELLFLWTIAILSMAVGIGTAVLHIDAIGHRNAFVFGSARMIKRLYHAIRDARNMAESRGIMLIEEEAKE